MRYDQLVCAACAGRVIDGHCPVCRQMRSQLFNRHGIDWHNLLVPILATLAALACLLAYYVRMA